MYAAAGVSCDEIFDRAADVRDTTAMNRENREQNCGRETYMKTITSNAELVAYCGLYCGACGAYLKGRCPGCHENKKATVQDQIVLHRAQVFNVRRLRRPPERHGLR